MPKKTKALSGAAQDAYFRRVLRAYATLPSEEREQLVQRLRQEVAQLRLRVEAVEREAAQPAERAQVDAPEAAAFTPAPPVPEPVAEPALAASSSPPGPVVVTLPETPAQLLESETEPAASPAPPFDPYSPNVIVVLRKGGRDAALSALDSIDSIDDLRLLAREQRLSVSAELSSAAELRSAIVTAAERRVANRLAAAS